MQVVGADDGGTTVGAIPTAIWEGPTARIIERRNYDRRHGQRVEPETVTPPPAPARNMIIGMSLLTFACGVALATAAFRLPQARADRLAQLERRAPAPEAPVPPPAAPAIIVQPLAKPAVEPAPAREPEPEPAVVAEPVSEPVSVKPLVIAKAAPAPRAVAARVARPRRPTPSVRAADLEADDPFDAPAARPARKWVDPFAE